MKPLGIDLFAGLGGFTEGMLAEGYDCIGFDIERHRYWMPEVSDDDAGGGKGTKPVEGRGWTAGCAITLGIEGASSKPRTRLVEYPAQLVLQDVLTLHGKQFRGASLIVASPPCQEYSYMAMPWSRAKAIAAEYRSGVRDVKKLTALFDACFRIQREAIEAAGHFIPLVVENVRGAIPWVGRSRANFGSFHIWGDVPALMPMIVRGRARLKTHSGEQWNVNRQNFTGTQGWDDGQKTSGLAQKRDGHSHTRHLTNQREHDGVKGFSHSMHSHGGLLDGVKVSGDWFGSYAEQKAAGTISPGRMHGKGSSARKAASAAIAKIPFALSSHIARVHKPSVAIARGKG